MNREQMFSATLRKFFTPINAFLEDDAVSEVLINGPAEIYVERGGKLQKTTAAFRDEDHLLAAARNVAQYTGKRITSHTARFDSRLPDGSRVHIILPKCARNGLCLSIRKFRRARLTLESLEESGSLDPAAKRYIETAVAQGHNLLVAGGTGTGKTSLLNAISAKIPAGERIIVIEDASELQLQQSHVVSLETAWPDRHGHGAVSIRELFHSALRMRPDRIVIGECRGGEALDLIQAMTSGHGGSMSTLHAETALDALHRLETLALMSGVELPLFALRAQIASAIDVVVQMSRLADGQRVVREIHELSSHLEGERYILRQIYCR